MEEDMVESIELDTQGVEPPACGPITRLFGLCANPTTGQAPAAAQAGLNQAPGAPKGQESTLGNTLQGAATAFRVPNLN